ncbi:helix-turn-helix domain-containing protein [Reinekea sp.]|jgi:LacI family transcriptional regulator|uniref:AraC family transcriptional regulator n=1 Tax=Reinekea sp. TaxID=1970455 RepID=UPI003989415A
MVINVQEILVLFNIKHPYDRKIIDGILDGLKHSNSKLQVTFMTYDEALLVAHDYKWDAIIADFDWPQNADLCASLNIPVVGLMSHSLYQPETTKLATVFVAPDTKAIVNKAKEHLVACGIKNFGYFSGMANEIGYWAEHRKNLFEESVKSSNSNWIGDFTTFNIREHLLKGVVAHTGYLCASDTQARQLITLANNLNIDVPGHIAVIGIDNDETENQLSLVPISSVPFDPFVLGREAFLALFELNSESQTTTRLVAPGDVINRLSAYLDVSDDPLVSKALKFIYCHFHRSIKAEQVILECRTSRNTLESRFKEQLNKTIHQVLHDVRLENAKELLRSTSLSIDAIAIQCGLSSAQYLYYIFRREVGMTPVKYREIKSHSNQ